MSAFFYGITLLFYPQVELIGYADFRGTYLSADQRCIHL